MSLLFVDFLSLPMQRGEVIKVLVFNIRGTRDPEVFINILFVSTVEFKRKWFKDLYTKYKLDAKKPQTPFLQIFGLLAFVEQKESESWFWYWHLQNIQAGGEQKKKRHVRNSGGGGGGRDTI